MKNLFLICAFGFSIIALPAFNQAQKNKIDSVLNDSCQYGQCQKIKNDGYQCRNCAQKDSYYCWSHRD